MTPCNEIGRTIQPATGAAEHNPNAAAPDIFTASVNYCGSDAPDVDCITAADPFNLLHNEGDRA